VLFRHPGESRGPEPRAWAAPVRPGLRDTRPSMGEIPAFAGTTSGETRAVERHTDSGFEVLGADDLQVLQSLQDDLDGGPDLENAENGAENLQNDDGHPDKNPAREQHRNEVQRHHGNHHANDDLGASALR